MLTRRQNAIYRPLVDKAWLAHCSRQGAEPEDRAARGRWYRKTLLESSLGVYTSKEITTAWQFDKLLEVFAVLSGDVEAIDYCARAQERRALWLLKQTMRKAGVDSSYVAGIARHMGYGDKPIEDLPAELILKINTALYMHCKRQGANQHDAGHHSSGAERP